MCALFSGLKSEGSNEGIFLCVYDMLPITLALTTHRPLAFIISGPFGAVQLSSFARAVKPESQDVLQIRKHSNKQPFDAIVSSTKFCNALRKCLAYVLNSPLNTARGFGHVLSVWRRWRSQINCTSNFVFNASLSSPPPCFTCCHFAVLCLR